MHQALFAVRDRRQGNKEMQGRGAKSRKEETGCKVSSSVQEKNRKFR